MVHCSRYRTAWVAWAGVSSSVIRISGWWSARSTHIYRSHWFHLGQSSSGESAHSMGSGETPEWQIPGLGLGPRRSLRLISNSINSNLCNSNNSKMLVRSSRLQWRINLCLLTSHWIKTHHLYRTPSRSEGITAEITSWQQLKSHIVSPDKASRHKMTDLISP